MRVVSLAPFRIAPPTTGGQRLIYDGARRLALDCSAFLCLAVTTLRDRRPPPATPFRYQELRAASSLLLAFERARWLPKIPYLWSLRGYTAHLARMVLRERPDVVEAHFPWLMPVRRRLPPPIRVVLLMQNVESLWYEPFLRRRVGERLFRALLLRLEAEGLALADHVVCLTEHDRRELMQRHGLAPERVSVIPPGYFAAPSPAAAPTGRRNRALYVGSGFSDDGAAARRLLDVVVPRLDPGMSLVIAGNVCRKLRGCALPPAVECVGFVSDLDALMRDCRALLNPDRLATGINMKVIGALGAGIPVISTPEGARGYEDLVGGPIRVGALEEFPALLRNAAPLSAAEREAVGRYEWKEIGARRLALYRDLCAGSTGTPG